MDVCILMGSPRPKGNTATLLAPFTEELHSLGSATRSFSLYGKNLLPCIACRACQDIHDGFGCPLHDDMQEIFDAVLACDCFILASPIYSWFCTPPTKAVMDRMVYGMNKFYGECRSGSLWKGKSCAILTTCGYKPEKGVDLFEEGVKRYCKHSGLKFQGMLAVRDLGYKTEFSNPAKLRAARDFARFLHANVASGNTENPISMTVLDE